MATSLTCTFGICCPYSSMNHHSCSSCNSLKNKIISFKNGIKILCTIAWKECGQVKITKALQEDHCNVKGTRPDEGQIEHRQ